MITLVRSGGLRRPSFRERLRIEEDGRFRMWRSVAMASGLPSPIGRFEGRLPESEMAALAKAAERVAGEAGAKGLIPPDSPIDRIEADGSELTIGIHNPGPGAWGPLVADLRAMLKDLTASPAAAIALEAGDSARLVHQGKERLNLDLSGLKVRATHWREGDSLAHWAGDVDGNADVTAGEGWSLDLPFDHGFAARAGDKVTVTVTFAAEDDGEMIPVAIQTP